MIIADDQLIKDAKETIELLLGHVEAYDKRLVELGDPKELVYSDVHKQGVWVARTVLARLEAACGEIPNTPINFTRGGHQPPRIK